MKAVGTYVFHRPIAEYLSWPLPTKIKTGISLRTEEIPQTKCIFSIICRFKMQTGKRFWMKRPSNVTLFFH